MKSNYYEGILQDKLLGFDSSGYHCFDSNVIEDIKTISKEVILNICDTQSHSQSSSFKPHEKIVCL